VASDFQVKEKRKSGLGDMAQVVKYSRP
jgi:hypothetical protein